MKSIQIGKRRISSKYFLAVFTSLSLCLGFYLKASGTLAPGPLSTMNRSGVSIDGYMSHADFSKECTHCHSPIHCITDTRCQDCHKDVAMQRSEGAGLHGLLPGTNRCQTCHPEHNGEEVAITKFAFQNVDHEALTGFSLATHKLNFDETQMNCHACHTLDHFGEDTLECINCHMERHPEETADHVEVYGMTCIPCHDGRDRMTDFDHQQVYPLEGGHTDLACLDCHANQIFASEPRDCQECHADPEVHLGQFGLDCSRCHTDEAWTPAVLTRHVFALDHGGEDTVCESCHVDTMAVYTCYGCHDHQPAQMIIAHQLEGITELEPCSACHPSGAPDEGRRMMEELLKQPPTEAAPFSGFQLPTQEPLKLPIGLVH